MTDALLEEILEELDEVDQTCSRCEKPMVTGGQWKRASHEERRELLDEGYDVAWSDICRKCHREDVQVTYSQRGEGSREERRNRTWKAYVAATERGLTNYVEIAKELGITPEGLRNAVRKAKLRGDIPS